MLSYFVTRKVCDGNIAGDFKHINSHSYPLFKAGHVQRIQVIKGNDNNMYLSAFLLTRNEEKRRLQNPSCSFSCRGDNFWNYKRNRFTYTRIQNITILG